MPKKNEVGVIGLDDTTSRDGLVLMNSPESQRTVLYKGMFLEIRDRVLSIMKADTEDAGYGACLRD